MDINEFKKKVRIWIDEHPTEGVYELIDYCEELIPPAHFTTYKWLVDQTASWFQHILLQREKKSFFSED